jgi:hypothetical protein
MGEVVGAVMDAIEPTFGQLRDNLILCEMVNVVPGDQRNIQRLERVLQELQQLLEERQQALMAPKKGLWTNLLKSNNH